MVDIDLKDEDVLIFTEVNAKNFLAGYNESEFKINRFKLYTKNFMKKGLRGIFCYVRSNVNSSVINLGLIFNEYLCIKIGGLLEDLIILVIYRSPHSENENNTKLLLLLKKFMSVKGKKIIVGDFNFPSIDWKNVLTSYGPKSIENKFINFINDNFLSQLIDVPTRYRDSQKCNLLDLVLVQEKENIFDIRCRAPIGKSDHCVVSFEVVGMMSNYVGAEAVSKLNFSKGDYKLMNVYLQKNLYKDEVILINEDIPGYINKLERNFTQVVSESIGKFIPFKNNILGEKHRLKFPKFLLDLLKLKNKIWKRYIKTKDINVFIEFKKIRNNVKRSIVKLKESETLKLALKIKKNQKVFWHHINKVRNNRVVLECLVKTDLESETILTNDKEKADYLADFFKSVFIDRSYVDRPCNSRIQGCLYEMDDLMITDISIKKKIDALDWYKSAGPDNIFAKIIKECKFTLSDYLCKLFNESLHFKIIPDNWRYSTITPVYKKGDKCNVANYRPVSLCCISCKLLESFVKDALIDHFHINNLFDYRQYGFRKGKSTTLQLLKLMDNWCDALERGEVIDVIYTDFEKAFDKVPHDKLIWKLFYYGVNESLIEWIKNYLSDRTSSVRVNGSLSDSFHITSGVPQGSVLGPTLFIIYVNDMFKIIDNDSGVDLFLYADDAKIFRNILSDNDRELLQISLNALACWCDEWDIKLNVEKCVAMRFGKQINDDSECMYNIVNHRLECCSIIKDLGVIFDRLLKFDNHIYEMINKGFSTLGLISRNFNGLNKDSFLLLYKSLVRSKLEYAVNVWSPWRLKEIEAIERVQKRATKMVKECENLKYIDRLKLLNLPCLRYRRSRGDLIMVYNMLKSDDGNECYPRLTLHDDRRTRGHEYKLNAQRFHGNLKKFSFPNRVVALWNALKEDIVQAKDVNNFKNKLDAFMINFDFVFDYKQVVVI